MSVRPSAPSASTLPTTRPATNWLGCVSALQMTNRPIAPKSTTEPAASPSRPSRVGAVSTRGETVPVDIPFLLPQIEAAHLVALKELARVTFQSVLPTCQHVAPVAEAQRLACVLLDHQDGGPGGIDLHHLLEDHVDHLRRQAGRRLVEQQQL